MNKYKIKDANLARLINTFAFAKGFSYIAYVGDEGFQMNIYYKKCNFNITIHNDNTIYRNIVFRDEEYQMETIAILPNDSNKLDGFGLAKGYHELCKLIGCDNELSSDETCLLSFVWEHDWNGKEKSLREEKKKVSRKMKPYYLAFRDVSFKDVGSKVVSQESLIKKYFKKMPYGGSKIIYKYIHSHGAQNCIFYEKLDPQKYLENKKHLLNIYNKMSNAGRVFVPVSEWKGMSIQGSSNVEITPMNSIQEFIDECTSGPLGKSPFRFKHSNPRITNKNQIKNYVSEYNNDRDFYDYLSSNSSTQS